MTLKNKDGTPYKLNDPKPLPKNQDIFDWSETELHNLNWANKREPQIKPQPLRDVKKEQDPIKEKIVEKKQEPIREIPKEKQKLELNNVISGFCMPKVIKTNKDNLYGEETTKVTYGDKISFECILIERNDLFMQFWVKQNIQKDSIVYLSRYQDGSKFAEYRWWKVTESEDKSGGYLMKAVISDIHPDFT